MTCERQKQGSRYVVDVSVRARRIWLSASDKRDDESYLSREDKPASSSLLCITRPAPSTHQQTQSIFSLSSSSSNGRRLSSQHFSLANVRSNNIVLRTLAGLPRTRFEMLEPLIQRHCVTDTRHLQASAEDTYFRCFPYLTDLYWTSAAQFFL